MKPEIILQEWGQWQKDVAEVGGSISGFLQTQAFRRSLDIVTSASLQFETLIKTYNENNYEHHFDSPPCSSILNVQQPQDAITQQEPQKLKELSAEAFEFLKMLREHQNIILHDCDKFSKAFSSLYKTINNLPDLPHFCLEVEKHRETLQTKIVQLEDTQKNNELQILQYQKINRKLQEEINDFEREFGELKNQDRLVRQLQESIDVKEEQFSIELTQRLEEKKQQFNQELNVLQEQHLKEMENLRESVVIAARKQEVAEQKQVAMEKALFQMQQNTQKSIAAKEAELGVLVADLEHSDRQVEILKAQLDATQQSFHGHGAGSRAVELEAETEALKQLVTSLTDELKCSRDSADTERRRLEEQLAHATIAESSMHQRFSSIQARVSELESELAKRPSTDDITQLRQRLLEATTNRSIYPIDSQNFDDHRTSQRGVSFQKIQQLESEVTALRIENLQLLEDYNKSENLSKQLSEQVQDLQNTINKYEETIGHGGIRNDNQQHSSLIPTLDLEAINRSIGISSTHQQEKKELGEPEEEEFLLELIPEDNNTKKDDQKNIETSHGTITTTTAKTDGVPTLLDIANAQKKRFREKQLEAEQNRDYWKQRAQQETLKCSRLHKDNVALLEKICFLQQWQQGGIDKHHDSKNDDDSFQKYYKAYEAELAKGTVTDIERGVFKASPTLNHKFRRNDYSDQESLDDDAFNRFRVSEKLRSLKSLSQVERSIVVWGSALLSTRITRLGIVAYLICLHILVMLSLHPMRCPPCPL